MNYDKSVFQDSKLSLKARGMYGYLASLPTLSGITQVKIRSRVPDGMRGVRSSLHELEQRGYLKRYKKRNGIEIWRIKRRDRHDNADLTLISDDQKLYYKVIVFMIHYIHVVSHLTVRMKKLIINSIIRGANAEDWCFAIECFAIKRTLWECLQSRGYFPRDIERIIGKPIRYPINYINKIVTDGNAKHDYRLWCSMYSENCPAPKGKIEIWQGAQILGKYVKKRFNLV